IVPTYKKYAVSFIRNSKKALKFTFVTIPVGVLGGTQLRIGNEYIRDLWHTINGVVCPSCKSGTLLCKKDSEHALASTKDGKQKKEVLYPWACTNCDFVLLEVANTRIAKQTVHE